MMLVSSLMGRHRGSGDSGTSVDRIRTGPELDRIDDDQIDGTRKRINGDDVERKEDEFMGPLAVDHGEVEFPNQTRGGHSADTGCGG